MKSENKLNKTKRIISVCKKKSERECLPPCQYFKGTKRQFCRLTNGYEMDENGSPKIKVREPKLKTSKLKQNTKQKTKKSHSLVSSITKSFNSNSSISNSSNTDISSLTYSRNKNNSNSSAFKRSCSASDKCSPAYIPDAETPETEKSNHSTQEKIKEFKERFTKKNATRKIGRFIKNVNPNKRRSYFLKSVCSDSGVCIAFGRESLTIKKHFKNFTDFSYLVGEAKRIGKVSANGFVKELTYENEGYKVNSVLKSSTEKGSDNLLYEGLVGQYLNKVGLVYPCFLETYGIYKYNSPGFKFLMKKNDNNIHELLKEGLTLINPIKIPLLNTACKESNMIAINVQHLKNAQTLGDLIKVQFTRKNINDLISVLYQIYMPLAMLAKTFTHYDLHYNNVLIYIPDKTKYIHYHYHTPDGGITSFKSMYLAKIIDYGRCFFNNPEDRSVFGNSKRIYNKLCKMPDCVRCGSDAGFAWLELDKATLKRNYICSQKSNISHDLRLLFNVKDKINDDSENLKMMKNESPELNDMFKKLIYGIGLERNDGKVYGTKENKKSGLPDKINNVIDAYTDLNNIIRNAKYQTQNDSYYDNTKFTKLGDIHIYTDGKMIDFIPVK
jgi:hypothetical protein